MRISSRYMLSLPSEKYYKKDIGLYRDDGLGVVKNKSGRETEKIKKNIQKIFKENKSDIVIQCNMKIVNCLDISLNLIIRTTSLTTNLIRNYYISIKIQITHTAFLNKSPHRSKKESPSYHLTKPYSTNKKKYTKNL